ncbi:hypothetical protein Ddc_09047 [Ditylenchus destructor]|nr:hypothetical protein Ddc_09047 [Ditylenchus destructor]
MGHQKSTAHFHVAVSIGRRMWVLAKAADVPRCRKQQQLLPVQYGAINLLMRRPLWPPQPPLDYSADVGFFAAGALDAAQKTHRGNFYCRSSYSEVLSSGDCTIADIFEPNIL